jgi:hypothetical protein
VDDALGARGRIASALRSAFLSRAFYSATVDSKGRRGAGRRRAVRGRTSTLDADGRACCLDRYLPAWYAVLQSEGVSAVSVECSIARFWRRGGIQTWPNAGRGPFWNIWPGRPRWTGRRGRRLPPWGSRAPDTGPEGDGRVVLGFFLNNDALRAARAG